MRIGLTVNQARTLVKDPDALTEDLLAFSAKRDVGLTKDEVMNDFKELLSD